MKFMKKGVLTQTAGLVAGGVASGLVYSKTSGVIKNDKLRAAAPVIVGILLTSQKGKFIQDMGAGMIAVGGANLVKSFVPGLGAIDADEVVTGVFDDEGDGMEGTDVINGAYDTDEDYTDGDY